MPPTGACPRCQKQVFFAEQILSGGELWHKGCFNCKECKAHLDSRTLNNRDKEIYCEGCFAKNYGPEGYGYGQGAGTLKHTAGAESMAHATIVSPAKVDHKTICERVSHLTNDKIVAAASGVMVITARCPRCDHPVYAAEKIEAAGSAWHKSCFRCTKCARGLDASIMAHHEGAIYCENCYRKTWGPDGFRGGVSLSH